ncbi:hypothetical protein ACWEPC_18360, partial [Nonomuraea sp. NPDC004297]
MTLSTPLLAAGPLLAGLIGPALLGATPGHQQAVPAAVAPAHVSGRSDVVEHVAARSAADQRRVLGYWTPERMAKALPIGLLGVVTGLTDGVTGLTDGVTGLTDGVTGLTDGVTGRTGLLSAPGAPGGAADLTLARRLMGTRHLAAARPQASTVGSRWMTGGLV